MVVNTITVATAVTPTVIETAITHYLRRGPLRQKPTAHISYHEGLELIRRFLHYASFHTVEELQAFTAQWVPVPHWVHVEDLEIPHTQLERSAQLIQAQLGAEGIEAVGGKTWWQWRMDKPLRAEWIEMRKDYEERTKMANVKSQRIMLYVHGGAYFFGSVDEHRYQMQRHARKLKARVLAPRYRLAPQFPFPCGLQDCLATYLWLLEQKHDPSTILLAGDSAGGGMVLAMLVILRDQGVPLPAGGILLSPWVDLTHSFPSLGGDGKMDYIPAHGFIHKPSMSWPPPNADDILASQRRPRSKHGQKKSSDGEAKASDAADEDKKERIRGFSVTETSKPGSTEDEGEGYFVSADGKYSIGPKENPVLSVQLHDGVRVQIKDQIQLYVPNHLLTHPLVSPVLQPSLGGLPPLLIQVGGGELLQDEQVYLAHKAANPSAYLPPPSNHQSAKEIEEKAAKYRPTDVQLQVWEDLCHVCPTLSFTRPAKYMYRSIAQFGAWALAKAQKTSIDILDDDSISVVSSDTSDTSSSSGSSRNNGKPSPTDIKLSMPSSAQHVAFTSTSRETHHSQKVGKAGDPLPVFNNHMIRQRIDRQGNIYPLAPPGELVALKLPRAEIGVPKPGPVNKWTAAQKQWNTKFAKQKLKVQKRRLKEIQAGYEVFEGEKPPPTALAGRRIKGMKSVKKNKKSWGMSLWSLWGSKHDEATVCVIYLDLLVREEEAEGNDSLEAKAAQAATDGPSDDCAISSVQPPKSPHMSGLKSPDGLFQPQTNSRYSNVTDQGQASATAEDLNHLAPPVPGFAEATKIAPEREASPLASPGIAEDTPLAAGADDASRPQSPQTLIPDTNTLTTRPTRGGIAYPFRLKVEEGGRQINASTTTLTSMDMRDRDGHGGADVDAPVPVGEGERRGDDGDEKVERPGVERFVTADGGELLSSKEEKVGDDKAAERPPMERFETAVSTLTKS
ncbi:alpha/beta-hydrolase [Sporormia fimetaria CBS 119925]|uniref:Alpha/beta-hydrolase n=1 Tax=Sporormia fimetaria CBS 119925 TaxID=1340428 RepID=A0A6A6V6F0_9PLEO|nr:alpha/beta-hydrolase [Sporormia fimetaria CBS 119925]